MKIIKTAGGKSLKMSKKEWAEMGKTAGWIKESDDEIVEDVLTNPTPTAPIGWDPAGAKEESEADFAAKKEQSEEELWQNVTVSLETIESKWGLSTKVLLRGTSQPLSKVLKALKYRWFGGNSIWSKTVSKSKTA